jgi:hypothetical protein
LWWDKKRLNARSIAPRAANAVEAWRSPIADVTTRTAGQSRRGGAGAERARAVQFMTLSMVLYAQVQHPATTEYLTCCFTKEAAAST